MTPDTDPSQGQPDEAKLEQEAAETKAKASDRYIVRGRRRGKKGSSR